jgi:hypothetical protein
MAEGGQSKELEYRLSAYDQETVQYADGRLALSITGKKGVKFDFVESEHKCSPSLAFENEAIIRTTAGDYFIVRSEAGPAYIANMRETLRQQKLVGLTVSPISGEGIIPMPLPPLVFGEPWEFMERGTGAPVVRELLLNARTSGSTAGYPGARRENAPFPFKWYEDIVQHLRPNEPFCFRRQ